MEQTAFYEFVGVWIKEVIVQSSTKPCVIAINGPNGIGKTTMCKAIIESLKSQNLNGVSVSIDDFYLTHKEQKTLSEKHSDNEFLQHRGYPGTHDIKLGLQTIQKLKNRAKSSVKIPTYNKAANEGKGERNPETLWQQVQTPIDFILWEGWMLGFAPVSEAELPNEKFKVINAYLANYSQWNKQIDALVLLIPDNVENVIEWRSHAEENQRKITGSGLQGAELEEFSQSFVLALKTYLSPLNQNPPCKKVFFVVIGKDRNPAS